MGRNPEQYDSYLDYVRASTTRRRRNRMLFLLSFLAFLLAVFLFVFFYFHINTVYVEGNTRYSNEEISGEVMKGPLGDNSLILSLRYRFRKMPEMPFVEKMTLEILSNDTIKITVYEKAIAGYVEYLGSYVYFDRNGIVVETSSIPLEGVPQINGLKFSHIILYETLPAEDPDIFSRILDVTMLLTKYNLSADKIYFDSAGNMSLYFGDVRADLGQNDYTDEKISNLSKIIPHLEGKKGYLTMSSFTPESDMIIFQGTDSSSEEAPDAAAPSTAETAPDAAAPSTAETAPDAAASSGADAVPDTSAASPEENTAAE